MEECININSEGEASVIVYFTYPYFNKKTEIIGDTAFVYTGVPIDKIPFPGSYIINGDNFEYEVELIKQNHPPGDWELK